MSNGILDGFEWVALVLDMCCVEWCIVSVGTATDPKLPAVGLYCCCNEEEEEKGEVFHLGGVFACVDVRTLNGRRICWDFACRYSNFE